jgi:hypothetical protein
MGGQIWVDHRAFSVRQLADIPNMKKEFNDLVDYWKLENKFEKFDLTENSQAVLVDEGVDRDK